MVSAEICASGNELTPATHGSGSLAENGIPARTLRVRGSLFLSVGGPRGKAKLPGAEERRECREAARSSAAVLLSPSASSGRPNLREMDRLSVVGICALVRDGSCVAKASSAVVTGSRPPGVPRVACFRTALALAGPPGSPGSCSARRAFCAKLVSISMCVVNLQLQPPASRSSRPIIFRQLASRNKPTRRQRLTCT